jgi:hypothetical protein
VKKPLQRAEFRRDKEQDRSGWVCQFCGGWLLDDSSGIWYDAYKPDHVVHECFAMVVWVAKELGAT